MQHHQADQLTTLKAELQPSPEDTRMQLEKKNAESFQTMQDTTLDSYNILIERTGKNFENTTQQIASVAIGSVKVTEVVEAQAQVVCEETRRQAEGMVEGVKNTVALSHKSTLDALEAQSLMAREEVRKQLEELRGEINTDLTSFTTELQALREQIKQALDVLDPDIEAEGEKTDNTDATTNATKVARKVSTQIERITLGHQKMSMNYFESANQQSKQGFKLAWTLIFTAVGLLVFTISAAVFMAILHLYGFTILIGSIGTIGTTIVTVMGAISSFHAKTTEQFALAQKLLDRSYRPTIANAMCIGYTDEARKQDTIDKIVDSLLKNEAIDVDVKGSQK